ncbi:MAG: serine/threonine protein kinase [Myxococcales bacterium]|nr:serine/threonine protein kinase [Myxococcales bacterium]
MCTRRVPAAPTAPTAVKERSSGRVGAYQILEPLKKGGMACVYLATVAEPAPTSLLALKTLLPEFSRDRVYREMFATEGKVGLRLQHPNIVRTVESGQEGHTLFIAMEYLFGHDLSTVLRKLRGQGETMPLPLAVALARDLCAGLAYAHELSDEFGRPLDIVNRDVSPGNVMITFDGHVKLIDFGIAQTTIEVRSQIGSIKGKLSYMSPEQIRGLPVDARSDIFAVGTVLYEMLTGVHVFHDEGDFATMERVRRAQAPKPSTHNAAIDNTLDEIVSRSMAREASERHATSRAMLESLTAYLVSHGHAPSAADFSGFLRALFGPEIEQLTAARRTLLYREPPAPQTVPDFSPPEYFETPPPQTFSMQAAPPAPPRALAGRLALGFVLVGLLVLGFVLVGLMP